MTEAEARAHQGVGGLEVWLSLQPWQPALDGWTIAGIWKAGASGSCRPLAGFGSTSLPLVAERRRCGW